MRTMSILPYVAFAWAAPASQLPYVCPMEWITTASQPAIVAQDMLNRAPGRRAIFIEHAPDFFWSRPGDRVKDANGNYLNYQSPWLDHGVANSKAFFNAFWPQYKAAGASVDFVASDAEVSLSKWAISFAQIEAIGADPRYAPLGAKYGLPDVSASSSFSKSAGEWILWNAIMDSEVASYTRQAINQPLISVFPDAGYCEYYNASLSLSVAQMAPDLNGWRQNTFDPLWGSYQAPVYYHVFSQISLPGRNDGTNPNFAASPMPTLIWETESARAHTLSSNAPQIPWIAYKTYAGVPAANFPLAKTPYYDEALWHIMLCSNTTDVLFWNPKNEQNTAPGGEFDQNNAAMNDDLQAFSNATNGATSIQCITLSAVPYNSQVLVSGAECTGPKGKRRVFRITLAPGLHTATLTLPGDAAPRTIVTGANSTGLWIVIPEQ